MMRIYIVSINNLNIPKGYSIECIPIRNAKSITSGYNIAMNKSIEKVILLKDIIAKDFIKIETNTITNIIREIIFVYSNIEESNVTFIKVTELKEALKALKEFAELNSKELLKELNIISKTYKSEITTINK